jgi:hypothetical protein
MKNDFNSGLQNLTNDDTVFELEEIVNSDPSETPETGSYQCTHCDCKNFEMTMENPLQCKCGHDSKAHGLPY